MSMSGVDRSMDMISSGGQIGESRSRRLIFGSLLFWENIIFGKKQNFILWVRSGNFGQILGSGKFEFF
jgi:hypothetical protein